MAATGNSRTKSSQQLSNVVTHTNTVILLENFFIWFE